MDIDYRKIGRRLRAAREQNRMSKRMNPNEVIIYKGVNQTVILTGTDFQSDEGFEKWYHWMNENAADKRPGRFIALWKISWSLKTVDNPRKS